MSGQTSRNDLTVVPRALRAGSYEVELDYPIAFARTVRAMRRSATEPFRYMHLSGILAEKDQNKPLWFLQEGRRVKVRLCFMCG